MSTLQQLREDVSHGWDAMLDGWQKLYRRATGAITRFRPGRKSAKNELAIAQQSIGWGVLAAEVFDDDKRVIVRLEAPGMEKDDFDLRVEDNYLVIRGEKQLQRETAEGDYHITECAYGSFERAVPLPDAVEADKASASYKRGVLQVKLPKARAKQRRKISIATK